MSNPQNDEIDLVKLIVKVVKYFRKHFIIIAICIVLGIIISISIGLSKADVIQSRMVLYSDLLTKAYGNQISRNLNNLIHQADPVSLSQSLNITPDEASQIYSIDVEIIPEKTKDPEFENSTLIITAEFSNREILPKLQESIINYFRNNQFIKIRVAHRKEYFQKLITRIHREIQALDSVKLLYLSSRTSAQRADVAFLDPSEINLNLVDLYRQQIKYENALELVDSIQVVEGFTSIEKPPRLKTSLLIVFGFLGGLTVSLCFLGIKWVLKHTKPTDN